MVYDKAYFAENLLPVKMVMPMIPPSARPAIDKVPAVPRRNDGTDSARATTGITVVTAVPIPNKAEKAYS